MKINDKVIAVFLVSMGMFSMVEARQYVGDLSDSQKLALMRVTNLSDDVVLADGGTVAAVTQTPSRGK